MKVTHFDHIVQATRSDGAENVDHFCLMVEEADMAGLASKLRSQGVEIQQGVVRRWGAQGYGLSIYIKDPDGNLIELKSSQPAETRSVTPRETSPADRRWWYPLLAAR